MLDPATQAYRVDPDEPAVEPTGEPTPEPQPETTVKLPDGTEVPVSEIEAWREAHTNRTSWQAENTRRAQEIADQRRQVEYQMQTMQQRQFQQQAEPADSEFADLDPTYRSFVEQRFQQLQQAQLQLYIAQMQENFLQRHGELREDTKAQRALMAYAAANPDPTTGMPNLDRAYDDLKGLVSAWAKPAQQAVAQTLQTQAGRPGVIGGKPAMHEGAPKMPDKWGPDGRQLAVQQVQALMDQAGIE